MFRSELLCKISFHIILIFVSQLRNEFTLETCSAVTVGNFAGPFLSGNKLETGRTIRLLHVTLRIRVALLRDSFI